MWTTYVANELDKFNHIYNILSMSYSPNNDNTKTRDLSETMTNDSDSTITRNDDTTTSNSNSVTYGKITTDAVATYNETPKTESTTTNSGSDSNSGSTSSDYDSTQTVEKSDSGERVVSETITGANSIVDNMNKYIEIVLQHDLIDYILSGFEKRYLFYGGDFYDY